MSIDIIEQAEIIGKALNEHKRIIKALNELHSIQEGRATLTLQYLNIDHHTLNRAIDSASKDSDDSYTKLTHEVNKGVKNAI